MQVSLTIAGDIKIEGLLPKDRNVIKKALSLPNQSYHQAIKRNPKAKYYLSPYVLYYSESKDGTLRVGRGTEDRIRDYLRRRGIQFTVTDETVAPSCEFRSAIQLRDYQEGVCEEIAKWRSGMLRADTGSGKTILALKLAETLGLRTLVVVPKLDLLTQFTQEHETYFGRDAGIIQGKHMDVKDFTVATIQTLRKRIFRDESLAKEFGLVIFDECHLAVPKKSREVVSYFHAKNLYGFTATARRTDGQGKALEYIFGPIRHDIKMERHTPRVERAHFRGHIWMDEYHKIIKEQTQNEERNRMIVDIVSREAKQGKKILVLTKRIEHYEELAKQLMERGMDCITFNSKDKKEERARILNELRTRGDKPYTLLGTFSLLSTGIDIPSLDLLVIAGDLKSDVLAEQSAGRILRLFEGKDDPRIIDVVDAGNHILRNQAKERLKFYQAQGWEVIDYEQETKPSKTFKTTAE